MSRINSLCAKKILNYVKACGKRSILETKQYCPTTFNKLGLKYIPLKNNNFTNKFKIINDTTIPKEAGIISILDKNNIIGTVSYDVQTMLDTSEKILHFQGLKSEVAGQGVGTRLINELIETSKKLGCEGRLIANASPNLSVSGKLTNLDFYYKMGFRATNPQKDAKILELFKDKKEIPIILNYDCQIMYIPK